MAERLKILHGHITAGCNQLSASAGVNTSSAFKYTVDNSKLTYEQRKFYEENGFLVIKKLVSPDKLKKFRERFADICKREVIVPGMTIMRDVAIKDSEFVPGEQAVTKIQDFQQDDVMFEYCALPEVVEYVESFTGPDIVAMHTMLINKPPDSGKLTSRHPMHQDLHYFPFRPAERIVCSWTAMQKINRENGCLVVVPGTHTGELLVHEYPKWEGGVNIMYHGIQNYDPSQPRVHLEMEEGDTVFFHPLLIHGSGTNRSKDFRKSISCHYASGKAHYVDVAGTEQETIADEVIQVVRRKLGREANITFVDVWKYKSRTIKGDNQLNYS
ncbi:phytanoyl-CoA dioxygenase, peroxisomal-like [Physella acuta]|uniref:phytanoyl-CoA dioxygenase, peroxisomal-like n=1 Tax=Physella acuta TaxID=109671 RepID=UPI0027DC995C|nr:phytanoyl-CoA dioxygenase, peroxisomal-like [Physella acuta]XP_059175873.1 phytanoyl-CoA dioxygenase, peroxisomal-like [Physella acuta]XP_059175874.1 phytanoyl-CoA dioxygenase, peroxisomal-like [Physella acuta]XP_059175875.1 phytanoyl-CoA dioxygenase, peroxisomal-like [Physella acuta]